MASVAARARWREKNRDRIRAHNREFYLANRDRIRARNRAYYEANKDQARAQLQAWRERNREQAREAVRRRRARLRDATLGQFTVQQLEQRMLMFRGCWMCGERPDTVDHVKPLAAGGPHLLANLRPACDSCNSRKGSRWPL